MAQVVLKLQRAAGRCAALAAAPRLRLAQGLATDSRGSKGDEPTVISIDRSGLGLPDVQQQHGGSVSVQKEPETDMARHLKQLIQFRGGPITVAEYMKEVLTHPRKGFYMRGDVFGGSGHFTTSPEVSQLFGEMVGVWAVHVWELMGQPPKLRLVELGPGRGTLMSDLLRSTAVFKSFAAAVRVSLVEVSPPLREMQYASLQCQPGDGDDAASGDASASRGPEGGEGEAAAEAEEEEGAGAVLQGVSALNGAAVSWHRSLQEVPQDAPTVVVAHELFDALPVHQFVRVPERGWVERMVDMAGPDSPQHLRFVLSPWSTIASRLLVQRFLAELPPDEAEKRTSLEISPQMLLLAQQIGERVAALGGAALIVDYGHDGAFDSSLQAIRHHKFVGLLEQPGLADLSVRVDFSALRRAVQTSSAATVVHGPVTQQSFLLSLGIQQRLDALARRATPAQAEQLVRGFLRLVGGHHHIGGPAGLPGSKEKQDAEPDAEGMGLQYKVLAICGRDLPEPAGFRTIESS